MTSSPMGRVQVEKAAEADVHHARVGEVGRGRSTDAAPKAAAEVTEGRPETAGNLEGTTTPGTQCPAHVSSGLHQVREVARRKRKERFTPLLHHLTVGMLEDAYRALKPGASPGIDGVTWQSYGEDLRRKVTDLHARESRG